MVEQKDEDLPATGNGTTQNELNNHLDVPHTGDDDSVEEHLKHAAIIEAPDGGYGWVVLVCGFFCNVIVDGIIFTAPECLLPVWDAKFGQGSMAWGCALLAGCYLLVGPFASILANIYGCNKVAILGSFLASLGFLLSAIAQYPIILFATFGIIAGAGLGFVFLAAVISVSTYFNKRRALATGIAFCGSGIGTAGISLLNPWILGTMLNGNWRLYCVFLSILSLALAFFGYFFKPLQPTDVQLEEVTKITTDYINRHIDEDENQAEMRKDSLIQSFPRNHGGSVLSSRHLSTNRPFLSTIDLNISRQSGNSSLSQQNLAQFASKASMSELNRPLSKIDIFYTGSTKNLAERNRTLTTKSIVVEEEAHEAPQSQIYLSTIGLPTAEDYVDTGVKSWLHRFLNQLKSFLDISLLKSPSFVILAVGGFLTLAAFFIPFMYVQQFALSKGISKDNAKYLVTIIGLVNTAGRVICGGIADSPKVDPLVLSNVLIILGGIATTILPFFDGFVAYVVYCITFALGVAAFAALRSVISADLLGMERLTNAYGFLMLFMGVAALIGPPFASFLRNQTGSFGVAFIVMGCFMTLSGIISLPLRRINKWERKRDGLDVDENAKQVELEPLNN
ncbi:hypothetical protein M3Y97_00815600 [Aphelenchoides bicaudatus]|nr:hypothetical protein M3Y97_00815600 [Aphelenchoides bicaudatus]